ncbi:MAG: hypothetical protein KAX57_01205 [Rhodoferax sp.]|nr:hypothetical protein [Rhodoferax sp.]
MKILLFGKSGQVGCARPRHARLMAKTTSSAIPARTNSYCFKTKGSVPFILFFPLSIANDKNQASSTP